MSMYCIKCKGLMLGESTAGRQQYGHSVVTRIVGYGCTQCGNWYEIPERPATSVSEIKAPRDMRLCLGGRKKGGGPEPGPAYLAAIECFDLIATKRRGRMSWQAITNLICTQRQVQFSWMTLQRHYEAETLRRLDNRAIERKITRSARRLSRAVAT